MWALMKHARLSIFAFCAVSGAFAIACGSDQTASIPDSDSGSDEDGGGIDSSIGSLNDATTGGDSASGQDASTSADAGSRDGGAHDGGLDAGRDAGPSLVPDASGLTGGLFHYGHFVTATANSVGRFAFPTAMETVLSLGGNDITAFEVSANGAKIAFASDKVLKGRFDLYTANADGTGVALVAALTNAGRTISLVHFSPDGNTIAFVSDDVTLGAKDVYVVPSVGGAAPVLISPARGAGLATKLNADQVVFSRDSRFIAISGDFDVDADFELWIWDTTAAALTQIVNAAEAGFTTGTPVGVTDPLGWDANNNVYFTASLGTDGAPSAFKLWMASHAVAKQIVPGSTSAPNFLEQTGSFGISPDGTTIALSLTDATGAYPYALYTLPAGGGTATSLFAAGYTYLHPTQANPDFAKPLVFSPDGTEVGFVADYQGANADYELYVVKAQANSTPVRLFKVTPASSHDAKWLTWAPNSSRIAFTSDEGAPQVGNTRLFLTNDIVTPDEALAPIVSTPSGGGLTGAAPRWTN